MQTFCCKICSGKREKQPLDVSVEESKRVGLPGGGRKKASKELEINMQGWVISKRACHERVSCKMIRAMAKQMYTTVSDSHECWLAKSFPPACPKLPPGPK